MVSQRDKPWVLTGTATPNAAITACFNGKKTTSQADEAGVWAVELGVFPANASPAELVVTAASGGEVDTVTIHDVVVGDVWLLSGQSNMQLWLSRTAHNFPDVMDKSDNLLRIIDIPQEVKLDGPRLPLEMDPASWKAFNPKTAPDFSAVGYFFGSKLRERYDVPIGLIATAVGGTPIASWLSRDELDKLGVDCSETDKYADNAGANQLLKSEQKATDKYQKAMDKADLGLSENWAAPNYDDSGWETAKLTDFAPGAGVHWYRKTLAVPPTLACREAQIYLGTAIDRDTVYINGEPIGTTYYAYPPRVYSFTMPKGSITIAIRLITYGNGGEFAPGKNHFIGTDNGTLSLDGPWKRRVGVIVDKAPPQTRFFNYATSLYNGMIAPLRGTQIKGVAWYQGESDAGNPDVYGAKLKTLITSWRELFADTKLPFLIQQLAHWDHTGPGGSDAQHHRNWETLRNQQKTALDLPNVGLAAGYDVGEWNDLHPQGKRIVGERLARLATRIAYHESLPPNMFEQYTLG